MKTEQFSPARLTNDAHMEYVNLLSQQIRNLSALNSFPRSQAAVQALLQVRDREDDAFMQARKSKETASITEQDKLRDQLYTGFKSAVNGFRKLPIPAMKDAAAAIWEIVQTYKIDTKMQLDKQTSRLRNFIEDIMGNHSSEVALLSLTDTLDQMNTANETVARLMMERDSANAEQVAGALKLAREASDVAIEEVLRGVDSVYYCTGDSATEQFIKYQNELVDRFKKQVVTRAKKKDDTQPEEEEKADGE